MQDFKEVQILKGNTIAKKKLTFQDKGQALMVKTFLNAVRRKADAPIPLSDILAVSAATLAAATSQGSSATISI